MTTPYNIVYWSSWDLPSLVLKVITNENEVKGQVLFQSTVRIKYMLVYCKKKNTRRVIINPDSDTLSKLKLVWTMTHVFLVSVVVLVYVTKTTYHVSQTNNG